VTITGATAGTATLTISTTASSSSCGTASATRHQAPWYSAGGAALACILLFGVPARQRRWRKLLGMLLFLVALTCGMVACGGGGGGTSCGTVPVNGTPPGTYTVTVTAASGATALATTTVTLIVE
jgi:hypothetical protein